MISKVIHCCWFPSGGRKPALVRKCMESWRRFAAGWTVEEWNEVSLRRRFGSLPAFVEQALAARKWAFASDWARFAVMAAEGGVYLDTDVELVRPLDGLVADGGFFALSSDDPKWADPGLGFAAEKGDPACAAIARRYETMAFDPACHLCQTSPVVVNEVLGDFPDVRLLPARVLNPKGTCAGKVRMTEDTFAIHHYAASWFNWKQRLAYCVLPALKLDWILRPWSRR